MARVNNVIIIITTIIIIIISIVDHNISLCERLAANNNTRLQRLSILGASSHLNLFIFKKFRAIEYVQVYCSVNNHVPY